ncbi:hypothetical protein [Marinoscillum sp.]|uniref:hypothetical protein n=1 Tax=Marinoscillum sp. TaxID=2024838 RepID=UPI003BAC0F23
MRYFFTITTLFITSLLQAQSGLPYSQIPDYPEEFTAETATARMIDGLGFRYYWATDSLRAEDLAYKPSEEGRTSRETLEHIHGLANFLLCTTRQQNQTAVDVSEMSFEELRASTLSSIEEASNTLKSGKVKLDDLLITFEGSDKTYPFWNQLNGPIADALWHVGQVVLMRRSSGNPFNSNVSVFTGTVRN